MILLLMFMHILLQGAISAMETEIPLQPIYKPTNSQQLDDSTDQAALVTPIHIALNNKYTILSSIFNPLVLDLLSLEKSQEIVSLAGASTPPLNKKNVKDLYSINRFFQEAINKISVYTLDTIKKKITCNNLCLIERPESLQPYNYLNTIPLVLKKFIMKKAIKCIDYKYHIDLPQHANHTIRSVAINDTLDTAIFTAHSNSLFLWNLRDNSLITTFILDPTRISYMRFNQRGTDIVFVGRKDHRWAIYKLNLASKAISQIWQINRQYIGDIQYLISSNSDSQSDLLSIFTSSNTVDDRFGRLFNQNIIQIENNKARLIAQQPNCKVSQVSRNSEELLITKKYEAEIFNSKTVISKHQCPELYLCKRALKNSTQKNALAIIMKSESYKKLTDYEKQLVTQS